MRWHLSWRDTSCSVPSSQVLLYFLENNQPLLLGNTMDDNYQHLGTIIDLGFSYKLVDHGMRVMTLSSPPPPPPPPPEGPHFAWWDCSAGKRKHLNLSRLTVLVRFSVSDLAHLSEKCNKSSWRLVTLFFPLLTRFVPVFPRKVLWGYLPLRMCHCADR